MGATWSSINVLNNVSNYISGKKRKHTDTEDDEINKIIDIALHTPKRKKLITTAQYIYEALFEQGKNSDVTSPYFASMFGGSWLESTKKFIYIDVVDPLITVESLKVVFGSLYNCEITLNPLEIVSTLATATMFQLEGLIDKCTEVMLETVNPKTSIEYYNAACQYGDRKLKEVCFRWFQVNLMTYYFTHPLTNLKNIPISLMTKLIAHSDLFVMQTEYSIYVMLKCWMYMLLHPDHLGEDQLSTKEINNYYCSRKNEMPYLFSERGKIFTPVFQGLRLHNLVSHQMDVELVLHDNIIPAAWLNPVVLQQWRNVLRVNQNDDKGIYDDYSPCEVADELFLSTSLRCGRILQNNERHIWRWTGFHFGMDLLMMTDGHTVSIKRNHRSENEQLLSFQTIRHIAIRVTVVKINEQRQIVYSKQSDILKLGLSKGEEIQLMQFDKTVDYPIIISANILYTSPESQETNQQEVIQTVS